MEGCPICGGPLVKLGRLGTRQHYRCRDCGAESSRVMTESEKQLADDMAHDYSMGWCDNAEEDCYAS